MTGCYVGVVDSRLKPLMPSFVCGRTGLAPLNLQVSHGSVSDLIVFQGHPTPSTNGEAYVLHFPDVLAGQEVSFRADPSKLAHLKIKLSEASGPASVNAYTFVQLPSFCVEWTSPWFYRDTTALSHQGEDSTARAKNSES
jgi:hypothetical protein